ncbi:MAG: anaerobic ribonucleoside-triphosphate reductase activating protein [Verrucomicrobia bacterium GWF2_51_19]|nr:MAG: anaerobic ribonucleoside-triphosphate reductase activating protein [Verrucomicrobia bacterium GWF2_51_19]HCJ12344.1 anaerobic ribonucleoside-triphosphate reductase activating protein [Opitutae bacterium]
MKIGGLHKCSYIDYPGNMSAVVFAQGCPLRCPYCHNPELLSEGVEGRVTEDAVWDFLKTRVRKLDAVVVTGGEPCMQPDLMTFLEKIKKLGFLIKLDSNGYYPKILKAILDAKLVDYVAMDVKAPLDKYQEITRSDVLPENIAQSIQSIKTSGIDCEFRTTVVRSQLSEADLLEISKLVAGHRYFLQKFVPTKPLDKRFLNESTYSDSEFAALCEQLKTIVPLCDVR